MKDSDNNQESTGNSNNPYTAIWNYNARVDKQYNYFGKPSSHKIVDGEVEEVSVVEVTDDAPQVKPVSQNQEKNEELFKFIHPSIPDEEAWSIHQEIKNLVKRNGIQMICDYLRQLKKEKKILLPQSPAIAYAELVRMGMPTTEGFAESTFRKYYNCR